MKRPRAAGIMARAGTVPFSGLLGAVLAIPLLAGPAGAQQPPPQAVRQIEALLAEKAQRTPAQRKVSSQLLEAQRTPPQRTVNSQLLDEQGTPTQQKLNSQLQDALRAPLQKPTVAGTSRLQATDPDAKNERVMVDIRTDVTPTVLKRIRIWVARSSAVSRSTRPSGHNSPPGLWRCSPRWMRSGRSGPPMRR